MRQPRGAGSIDGVEELDAASRAVVADYWWRRAQGELTSWVGFRHVLADLRAERSPEAIVALAERAVDDERRHAEWCREWAVRFGHPGGDLAPRADRPVSLPGATEETNRLLRIALCCMTETVGCVILRHARRRTTGPELRRLQRRHMADELQHARVGWGHLATLDTRKRALLRQRLPELIAVLPHACCEGPELDRDDLVPWGYFTPTLLRAAHDEAVRDLILPGLRHVGLEVAA